MLPRAFGPLLLAAVVLTFLPGRLAAAPTAAPRHTLVIGSISDNLTRETKTFAPLARYQGERLLGDVGLRGAEVAVVATADEMAAGLAGGAVDLYIDSPFIVAEMARRAGAVPFLRRWKGGVAEYHSVFFARAHGGPGGLDDLRGRAVAFDEPYSS